ncbi:MAG: hypothetical protein IKO85_03885 [Bacteroidaceae bacterium]|nr:hypothetical protein [Bacteroidaceae bacterium]
MINNRLYRNGLNGLNGANRRHEAFGRHGASGLRGLRCGALSFIIYHCSLFIYHLSFFISLTCLSACSSHSDDTPEPTPVVETGTPISFSGQESEAQDVSQGVKGTRAATRAGTPLHESGTGTTTFTVWGYKNMRYTAKTDVYDDKQEVFPGYQVVWHSGSAASTTTNTNGWEYVMSSPEQTIKYWDWSAKAYRFFAVTGGLSGTSGSYGADGVNYWTSGDYGTYKITLEADASSTGAMEATPYFSHLWFSTGNEVAYPDKLFGKPVVLEFLKPYARVRFIFKYSYPREGINLTGVSFAPTTVGDKVARRGTVTVHYPLAGKETKEWYTIKANSDPDSEVNKALTAFTEDYDLEDDSKKYTESDKGWYTVLPNNTQGSYTLSVNVNGTDRTAVVPAKYMTWLPGYSYTYIFKILQEGGVEIGWVEYAVTPWSEFNKDHTVYNW